MFLYTRNESFGASGRIGGEAGKLSLLSGSMP